MGNSHNRSLPGDLLHWLNLPVDRPHYCSSYCVLLFENFPYANILLLIRKWFARNFLPPAAQIASSLSVCFTNSFSVYFRCLMCTTQSKKIVMLVLLCVHIIVCYIPLSFYTWRSLQINSILVTLSTSLS